MQENCLSVQKGFGILIQSLSGFIGQELNRVYKNRWWDEVLDALSEQWDLPLSGSYAEKIDSLDIANCIRLIDRRWNDVFKYSLPISSRSWAKELMGVRNVVAHIGQQDLSQPEAERALNTMLLLCREIDTESAEEINEIYKAVRARAADAGIVKSERVVYEGALQPASDSNRGELTEGSLLSLVGTEAVQKTTLSRKVTYGGKTQVYPVYKVRLDKLYYNDQNDRIATWISKYEAENGKDALNDLNVDIYNRIIEGFIVESNPDSIRRTQKNIDLVGQREPGVTLTDGRVVDGNRRFTCLRRIQRERNEPIYFETVLMDVDIQEDKKQIKLLELAIQHGEEKKVDYDLIDYAIGTYRDVEQTHLLTADEYAASTNESVADVRKRIEIAEIICEFLEYIRLPEQYFAAREYQVYSIFQEMMVPLRQLNAEERDELKVIAFDNVMMRAIPDQRKFIRDIKALIKNHTYKTFFEDQLRIQEEITERYRTANIREKQDVDRFARENEDLTEELQLSMERALLRSRSVQLKAKPAENISKSIGLLADIDTRLLASLSSEEKEQIKAQLEGLEKHIANVRSML